eukprot:TRINITY_DN1198_c1_g1_i1.p2 TRINITY_DN1198_c1_g1~~TRINITY_DN1198_c1_g1_i1.p2  ORF type:complete len:575 (+),score=108.92 TRINITY_DN1198_c1_g1_i1:3698-5422(+)
MQRARVQSQLSERAKSPTRASTRNVAHRQRAVAVYLSTARASRVRAQATWSTCKLRKNDARIRRSLTRAKPKHAPRCSTARCVPSCAKRMVRFNKVRHKWRVRLMCVPIAVYRLARRRTLRTLATCGCATLVAILCCLAMQRTSQLDAALQNIHGHVRIRVKPSTNQAFECSICRINAPCVSNRHQLFVSNARALTHAWASWTHGSCEIERDKSGAFYAQAQHSSKRSYINDISELGAHVKRSYVRAHVMNVASYSPHIPFFLWTVYVRALFLKRMCAWKRVAPVCAVSEGVYLVPAHHARIAWIDGTIAMLLRRVQGVRIRDDHREQADGGDHHHHHHHHVVCFRSAVMTDCLRDRVTTDGERLLVGDVNHPHEAISTRAERAAHSCARTLSVLIIGRNKTRQLVNWRSVRRMVQQEVRRAELCARIRVSYFERQPFHAQTQLFRHAHIVVASHGAALGHIVSARSGALVLDVFPVGYNFRAFRSFAAWSNVSYHMVDAQPDVRTMRRCLRRRRALFARWLAATAAGAADASTAARASHVSHIHAARRCIRAQRLRARVHALRAHLRRWLRHT